MTSPIPAPPFTMPPPGSTFVLEDCEFFGQMTIEISEDMNVLMKNVTFHHEDPHVIRVVPRAVPQAEVDAARAAVEEIEASLAGGK